MKKFGFFLDWHLFKEITKDLILNTGYVLYGFFKVIFWHHFKTFSKTKIANTDVKIFKVFILVYKAQKVHQEVSRSKCHTMIPNEDYTLRRIKNYEWTNTSTNWLTDSTSEKTHSWWGLSSDKFKSFSQIQIVKKIRADLWVC